MTSATETDSSVARAHQQSPIDPLRLQSRRLRLTAVAFSTALVTYALCWLLVTQLQWLSLIWPARLFAIAVACLGVAVASLVLLAAWRRRRELAAAIGVLLTLSFIFHLTGIDHEVGERAYRDEGTYYQHATSINEGDFVRGSFVYPHLLYYTYAIALWTCDLYPDAWNALATRWSGTTEALAHQWLALRLVVGLLAALTVVPVALIALALSGPGRRGVVAASLAGLFYVFSPLFNEGTHLFISDFPSACLATWCLWFVARSFDTPSWTSAALAGSFSGAAAATKYPAGTVAMAIVLAWLIQRFSERRIRARDVGKLAVSTLTSLATFLLCSPSFFIDPQHALFGPRGMLFGFRQYAGGGWLGVQPDSHFAYYVSQLGQSFGWIAIVLTILGLVCVPRTRRAATLALATFPAAYLGLIISMTMVVKRNLATAVPILAALAGVGIVALICRSVGPTRRPWAAGVLAAAALAQPTITTIQQTRALAGPSTRERAEQWLIEHLPPGTSVLQESYTPRLPGHLFATRQTRFAGRVPIDEVESGDYDVLLLASSAYRRFLEPDALLREHQRAFARRYEHILSYPKIHEVKASKLTLGPDLEIYRIPHETPSSTGAEPIALDSLFLPDGSMRTGPTISFNRPGQWILARRSLSSGPVTLRLRGRLTSDPTPDAHYLRVLTLDGFSLERVALARESPASQTSDTSEASAQFEATTSGTHFLYLHLANGSVLESLELEAISLEAGS